MLNKRNRKSDNFLGLWAAIHGAIFIFVSIVTFSRALRVAEILYAEDFDRSRVVPIWFGPWRIAMFNSCFATSVFLLSGVLLVVGGFVFMRQGPAAQRWLDRSLMLVLLCCFLFAVMLVVLSSASSNRGVGTPAFGFREELISNTFAVWFELAILLATVFVAKRTWR
jgi:hypothetical protein